MPAPPYGTAQGHEPVGSVDPSGDAVHTFTQHRTEEVAGLGDDTRGLGSGRDRA